MNIWQAIILGLVEGITEYLPVSSTGHLIITASLLGLDGEERKAAIDAFNIIIQGGAILAVVGLYLPRILQICRGLLGRDKAGLRLAMHLLVAFLPAAILGVLFNDFIEHHLFSPVPVLAALFLGGVWMIALDRWRAKRMASGSEEAAASVGRTITELTWSRALAIGLFQCVAMWPGTSR
ncbi:MAG: undecaprenyl-diphosphate phosphatase, partial [Phycisphaerales bacterium]|nr:undecaprenyl-diphosphate phosphatase [Phycisphaerales bacterium]